MHRPRTRLGLAALVLPLLALPGCPGLTMQPHTLQTSRGEVQALLGESDSFPRFEIGLTRPIVETTLAPETDLLVARHGDDACAFSVNQMAFHHVAQGTLDDEPFAIIYCVVCDAGVAVKPVIDGQTLHLSAGGLSNGVVLARDDETGSYWDVTGEAIAGPLAGRHLETWPIERTNVAAALAEEPTLEIALSGMSAYGTWWSRCVTYVTRDDDGYMPYYFRKTLKPADVRREELELGLGLVVDGQARFYPAAELATLKSDRFDQSFSSGEVTLVKSGDGQTWNAMAADGSRPFQVWGRWYGFSSTFPGCDVYEHGRTVVGTPVAEPALLATTTAPPEVR